MLQSIKNAGWAGKGRRGKKGEKMKQSEEAVGKKQGHVKTRLVSLKSNLLKQEYSDQTQIP
jgi:hypothetical protein